MPDGQYKDISLGKLQTCALTNAGKATCWGYWKSADAHGIPTDDFIEITSGTDHSCALTATGEIKCWGYDSSGQRDVPDNLYRKVEAGGWHTCGIINDGRPVCWGNDSQRQLFVYFSTVADISAGGWSTCAIDDQYQGIRCDGSYFSSGGIYCGVKKMSAGLGHFCGIKYDDSVECQGLGLGELNCTLDGIPGYECGQSIAPVGEFLEIAAGWFHSCAIKKNGEVKCWGRNEEGQLAK